MVQLTRAVAATAAAMPAMPPQQLSFINSSFTTRAEYEAALTAHPTEEEFAAANCACAEQLAAKNMELKYVGHVVVIDGLKSKPELNGKSATIIEGMNNGRYRVSIEGDYGEIVLAIKHDNLAPRPPRQ